MIYLDDNFHIRKDSYSWVLVKKGAPKKTVIKGEEKITRHKQRWYFHSITQALKTYLNEALKPCKTVEEILVRIAEVEEVINNLQIFSNSVNKEE